MRSVWRLGVLTGCLCGCAAPVQEKFQQYNEDGVYLFQRGDYGGARESFQRALTFKPEDPALLYNVGECYERQGDSAKAEQFYGVCLQRAPNHADCRHALAVLLVREGRGAEATRMVQDWLAREPK